MYTNKHELPVTGVMEQTTLKLLMIGDSGTGKSSLLLRFIEDKFLGEDLQSATIGVDFKVKLIDIDGTSYKLTIWVHSFLIQRTLLDKRDFAR